VSICALSRSRRRRASLHHRAAVIGNVSRPRRRCPSSSTLWSAPPIRRPHWRAPSAQAPIRRCPRRWPWSTPGHCASTGCRLHPCLPSSWLVRLAPCRPNATFSGAEVIRASARRRPDSNALIVWLSSAVDALAGHPNCPVRQRTRDRRPGQRRSISQLLCDCSSHPCIRTPSWMRIPKRTCFLCAGLMVRAMVST